MSLPGWPIYGTLCIFTVRPSSSIDTIFKLHCGCVRVCVGVIKSHELSESYSFFFLITPIFFFKKCCFRRITFLFQSSNPNEQEKKRKIIYHTITTYLHIVFSKIKKEQSVQCLNQRTLQIAAREVGCIMPWREHQCCLLKTSQEGKYLRIKR